MRFAPLAVALLCLAAAGCSQRFVSFRDYGRVADCYAAFFSVHMDARDPDLGLSEAQISQQELVTLHGINRMSPFIIEAKKSAGGEKNFLKLVAGWRHRPQYDVVLAGTPKAKAQVYQRILAEAARCHKTLDRWGAAPAYREAAPDAIPANPIGATN